MLRKYKRKFWSSIRDVANFNLAKISIKNIWTAAVKFWKNMVKLRNKFKTPQMLEIVCFRIAYMERL
jgi:hypothetical protein